MDTQVYWKNLLEKATEGDADSQNEVGDIYSSGLASATKAAIVEQDFVIAFKWYESAASNGNADGLTNLGDFLSEGKGCKKDIKRAIEVYLQAFNKGSARAAFNLGTVYRDKEKFKKAFKYYSLANAMDKEAYLFTIALCYYYGIGIAINKKIACKYFLKVSADKLHQYPQYEIDEANYILGMSYLTGHGIKKSIEKSRIFLALAKRDNDHRSAEQILFITGK